MFVFVGSHRCGVLLIRRPLQTGTLGGSVVRTVVKSVSKADCPLYFHWKLNSLQGDGKAVSPRMISVTLQLLS